MPEQSLALPDPSLEVSRLHLAELHLHDFFTGIQMYAATQPSCQLFQAFVTKGKKNNEPEFGEPEALRFYLEVISALNPEQSVSLFPKADDKGVCYVKSEKGSINESSPPHIICTNMGQKCTSREEEEED